ncbi:hypothetical protein [Shewanella frigidimarina]|uniref:hypothetical protein n=1 Tax=Shewanella frigidimarina TaxID=56812 RepID=UPI000F5032C5|nr:hypothetical protein [Shewanella frigidimarina]RPA27860.1 hypothetical protein EGC78_16560 [Shewanella frigidimarina]
MGRLIMMIIAVCLLTSCAQTFFTVPFKYSSNSHLDFRSAMVTLNTPPEELIFDLSKFFRKQGAIVLQREKLDYRLEETTNAFACWEAQNENTQKEFMTYSVNSYTQFQQIDRKTAYNKREISPSCKIFNEVTTGVRDSWLLMVQFPPEYANKTIYRPTSSNLFIFGGQNQSLQGITTTSIAEKVQIDITTRLYLWAWESDDGKTNIYLEGRPVIAQVEATLGYSIGWVWWKVSNGYRESEVIRSYVLLLQDYDRERSTY